jgi:hypothetical protein
MTRAELDLPGPEEEERVMEECQGGEMTQTMYAHVIK